MNLTSEQLAAVEATDPEVLVEAGPGAGKTTTLAARLVHLVRDRKVEPSRILALTFTRSAAEEIRSRARLELGDLVPMIRTFHTFAAACFLPEGQRIATRREVEAFERSLYKGPTRRPARDVPGIKGLRRNCAAHEATPPVPSGFGAALGGRASKLAGVRLLLQRMRAAGVVPLFDLVPSALSSCPWPTFEHVLIDEYQDTTPAELELCRRVLVPGGELFAVGDPRQAIMLWRGASGFVGTPTHRLALSFRFGQTIANTLNELARRFGGNGIDGVGEPGTVDDFDLGCVPELLRKGGGTAYGRDELGNVLILARTRAECRELGHFMGSRASLGLKPKTSREDPLEADADLFSAIWERGEAVISTVHSAKGREADTVIVALELDDDADDEEKRVTYVAASRARRHLLFVDPVATSRWGA